MQLLATIPIAIGAIIMMFTIHKYHGLLKFMAEETYEKQRHSHVTERMVLVFLYVSVAGFGVGIADTLIRGVDPVYYFFALIFFFGSLFVFFSIENQRDMATRLREKTIETMRAFVNAIEMKDAYTKGHSEHVYGLVELLYEALDPYLQEKIIKSKLLDAAMLHDIGKISIQDGILNKPGKLNEEEWETIKTHPFNGKKMLEDTCYAEISDWVLYHHERVDGNGYYGLAGGAIPVESKLIAIADTYSALCTDRVYRKGMPHEKAVEIMKEAAGTQLDREFVNRFLTIDEGKLAYVIALE
ncbi:HD-GYP domain-containing protein (c-di-GMP phosphodiesterase class II) [Clostridiales Family XIII bacterium PM5-7]